MSFYIVTKIFSNGLLTSDEALKIARAYELTVDSLERKGALIKQRGEIRLLFFDEQRFKVKADQIDQNNLHQQTTFSGGFGQIKMGSPLSSGRFPKMGISVSMI